MSKAVLHSATGPKSGRFARSPAQTYGELRPQVAPFSPPVVRVSGPDELLATAAEALPVGAARAEAVAVRLRRLGVALSWGEPDLVPDGRSFIRLCYDRGASSVEVARADPTLLTELQLGSFFHAYWRRRLVRRIATRLTSPAVLGALSGPLGGLAADFAFWLGVRSAATQDEWDRYTRSSYVVFYYHRIGAGGWPGQEHLHLRRSRFERQLQLLRLLRFRPISADELIAFHSDPNARLPARSFVLTADDGLRPAVDALREHPHLRPQVFVNTSAVGRTAWWAGEEPVADWQELRAFEAVGGVIGSHCRGHPRLTELDAESLSDELAGSLQDLQRHVPRAAALVAYPHGLHDERVRAAAAAAGYRAAFTTAPGRNGAGTDVYCLRRIPVTDWDGYCALLWKTLSGELLPWIWERSRRTFGAAKVGSRAATGQPREPD